MKCGMKSTVSLQFFHKVLVFFFRFIEFTLQSNIEFLASSKAAVQYIVRCSQLMKFPVALQNL